MNNATLINQNSSDVEYYTPAKIVEAAREAMGSIDLDPASSAVANKRVRANTFYSISDNGITKRWFGNVFTNHPFGRKEPACAPECDKDHVHHDYELYGNAAWIKKALDEYAEVHIRQACILTYACTSEGWFAPLLSRPQCFLLPRTNYELPDGTVKKGVTKGSVVTYLGNDVDRFAKAFASLGTIHVPYVHF